jgi:hypothetical protein
VRNSINFFVLFHTMDTNTDNTIKKILLDISPNIVSEINNINSKSNLDENENEENTSKKMFILTNPNADIKNIKKKEKEKKLRVETNTWGLITDDLLFEKQLLLLQEINTLIKSETTNKKLFTKQQQMIISHIKTKISSYKQQDIIKKKLNNTCFVSFDDVIELLIDANMKCYYCACETYLLYEIVREMKQWSLDRINNEIGHNKHNLVICCLECNLKRRRTNKDAFFFTKNLKITKEGYSENDLV